MKTILTPLAAALLLSTSFGTAQAALKESPTVTATQAAPGESTQTLKDAFLKGKLVGALAFNPHVNVFDIQVEVTNNQAHLGGAVETAIERDLAVEIARGIDGITGVDSDIAVQPGARAAREEAQRRTLGQTLDDAGTTTSVKGKLLANRSTHGLSIGVSTRNGVVTLSGKAQSDAEKDLAERIAENTDGVLNVRNDLVVVAKR